MIREIIVELGERSYPIIIKRGLLSDVGPRVKGLGFKGKAAIVTNPLVGRLYANVVLEGLKDAGFDTVLITVPDGEEYKSLTEASYVYDSLIEHRMERSSPIVALGGGVIGDLAGFVASTYLRGVPYIQVPTTLLSQVDSSVGGKTGVNHPKGKNLIGAFYQPRAVYMDPDVLGTLAPREITAGLAEVVKYGVIWDKGFFESLEKNSKKLAECGEELVAAIERSCSIKAEVVAADEKESGVRSYLNLGHTFGHAIEALSGYGNYKHGEAVAIGMRMAADLSVRLGMCAEDTAGRIKALISSVGLPVEAPGIPSAAFIESMRLDKKVSGAAIRFVLINGLGDVELKEAGEETLRDFFKGVYGS